MDLKVESNAVGFLRTHEGWEVYERYLREEFDKEYSKLRRYAKKGDEEHLLKIAGKLDGLEFAMKLPDKIINRGEL